MIAGRADVESVGSQDLRRPKFQSCRTAEKPVILLSTAGLAKGALRDSRPIAQVGAIALQVCPDSGECIGCHVAFASSYAQGNRPLFDTSNICFPPCKL